MSCHLLTRLELKAKDINGSDRLTAGCVCQWVKHIITKFVRFCMSANFILRAVGGMLKVLPGQPN